MSNPIKIYHFASVNSERLRLVRFTFDEVQQEILDNLVELYGSDMYLFKEIASETSKIHYHGCVNLQDKKTTNRNHINKLKLLIGPTFHILSFKLADTYHRRKVNEAQGITREDFAFIYDSKDGAAVIQTGIWSGLPLHLYEQLNVLYSTTYKAHKSKKVPFMTQVVRDYKLSESYSNYFTPNMRTRMLYGSERADIFNSILEYIWNYCSSYNNENDVKKIDRNILTSFAWTIYNCYYCSKGCDFDSLNPFSNTC